MESVKTDRIAGQPHTSWPQVHARSAYVANVFVTVPDITIGHANRHIRYRRTDIDRGRRHGHCASGRHRGDKGGPTNNIEFIRFHVENLADHLGGRYGMITL